MKKQPNEVAIALRYHDGAGTPIISGFGERHLAKTIISIALRYGVPLSENQKLAHDLAQLELREIPGELYEQIAGLFAEVDA